MSQNIKPPRWTTWLLKKFASQHTLEEVEGDLREFFNIWKEQHGTHVARWKYAWTVITLLRPFQKKKRSPYHHAKTNMHVMIGSYFKMTWRTLLKNKVSSFINLSGLTLGLTTSLLIMLVVMDELGYDKFHTNLPGIHVLMLNQSTNDGISTGKSTAGPMAEALRTGFPEVKYAARLAYFHSEKIIINDRISFESGIYADPDLFRIMTFRQIKGDVTRALESNSSLVITRDMAKKLFGNENALGKTVVFNNQSYTVGAIIENISTKSSIRFDMVLPFTRYEKDNEWLKKWDDNRIMTWMLLQPSVNLSDFNRKITALLQEHSNDKTVAQFAYPLQELHLYGSFSNGKPNGGRITAVAILIAFGAFMLVIACINFMNIATAQSEHRAREVGVRKVLGATRKWIIFQFLNESFVITFLAMFLAVTLAVVVIPSFNEMMHAHISFDSSNLTVWILVLAIGVITTLLAGSYPSLFLSRFIPVKVLKGRSVGRKGGAFRNVLVTFQFAVSVFFLIGTIILYAQFQHVQDRPMGYEQENLIDIRLDSTLSAKYAYLKTEVLEIPSVRSVTGGSTSILYAHGSVTGMDWPGKSPDEDLSVAVVDVEYDWTKTIGIEIVAGRDFDPAFTSNASACLINESAAEKMGLKNPVGSVVGGHPVIGVFRNFVYNNPFESIQPMAVYLKPARMNHLYLRLQHPSAWKQTLPQIEKITKAVSPEFPFSYSFIKDEYQNEFNELADGSLMVTIFGGMTIFISCLGLFGLSGFVAEKRSKEMSIRKVFGATLIRVLVSLSRDFLKPVLIALVVVIPITVFIARLVLSNVSYRVTLTWWMFASGGFLILAIAIVIVMYHGLRTARENPVVRLRNE